MQTENLPLDLKTEFPSFEYSNDPDEFRPCAGAGWNGVIREMMAEMKQNARHIHIDDIQDQAGRLLCLYSSESDLDHIVDKYEQKSLEICQCCGAVGNRPTEGREQFFGRCFECIPKC